jgi:tetratricopeptide (TPR) repeat protein
MRARATSPRSTNGTGHQRGGIFWIGSAYYLVGRLEEASEAIEKAARSFSKYSALAAAILVRQGKLDEARQVLVELEESAKTRYVAPLALATTHAAVGDMDAALAWLERAFIERDPQLPYVKLLPAGLDALLADERVQAIIRKMGLPL